jgi:uncharacterized protein YjiS (DUF1127 family)
MNATCTTTHLVEARRTGWLQHTAAFGSALKAAFGGFVQRWRDQRRLDAELRTLEALSDETLRDIGLAERVLPRMPTPSLLYRDRGLWS